jgi:uncharacterized protein YjbI with pentapeptide repeats
MLSKHYNTDEQICGKYFWTRRFHRVQFHRVQFHRVQFHRVQFHRVQFHQVQFHRVQFHQIVLKCSISQSTSVSSLWYINKVFTKWQFQLVLCKKYCFTYH